MPEIELEENWWDIIEEQDTTNSTLEEFGL